MPEELLYMQRFIFLNSARLSMKTNETTVYTIKCFFNVIFEYFISRI